MDALEVQLLAGRVLLCDEMRLAGIGDAVILAHAHGAGVAAGVAAYAAFHFAFPEGEALFQRHGIEHGQLRGRAGLFFNGRSVAEGHIGHLGLRHGAVIALALGAVGDAEAVILAIGGNGHAGFVIDDLVDGPVAAEFLVDAGHVEGAFAGQGEDGDVFSRYEVFLEELNHGAGVAALYHHADLGEFVLRQRTADEAGEIGGGVVHVEGTPHQPVHVFRLAHEERHGMGRVVALLPADDDIEAVA